MALCVGSAMKEDLQADEERFNDDSLLITSAMKEDLQEDEDKLRDGTTIVGSDNL